jgi:hypothetical protein
MRLAKKGLLNCEKNCGFYFHSLLTFGSLSIESGWLLASKQMVSMLLAVVIAKSLIELSLMFIVGRFLLGLLAGANRDNNVFWQLLDVASKPALWLTRKVSPKLILDQHIPLAASSLLLIAWVFMVQLKIEMCFEMGIATCQ